MPSSAAREAAKNSESRSNRLLNPPESPVLSWPTPVVLQLKMLQLMDNLHFLSGAAGGFGLSPATTHFAFWRPMHLTRISLSCIGDRWTFERDRGSLALFSGLLICYRAGDVRMTVSQQSARTTT